eukprot:TRINITY_DN65408_c0_g1_i1.p1 TRINITY_DN65408_c0_g1~~TRINITY_DN65408_c0_g1_i1.p1  ORF type:complete len:652 (-),score=92.84 TRINITY_DN65408_c0_g1_i1:224-2179(-)
MLTPTLTTASLEPRIMQRSGLHGASFASRAVSSSSWAYSPAWSSSLGTSVASSVKLPTRSRQQQCSNSRLSSGLATELATAAAGLSSLVALRARGRRSGTLSSTSAFAGKRHFSRLASVGRSSSVKVGAPPPPFELGTVYSVLMHQLSREALLERFEKDVSKTGVLLFAGGGDAVRHDTDHEDVFRQESNFQYLFGVREPGYLAAIDVEKKTTTLFAPRLPPEYALWMGTIDPPDQILNHYGVDEVVFVDEIASWFEKRKPEKVYVQRGKNSDSGREVIPADFDGLREGFVVDEDGLHDVVYECRARKNEEELRLLRYVNHVSSDAHLAIMREARPGIMEYQLESTFAYGCYHNGGCRLLSYTPIAGSGPNSAVLHYGHAGAPNSRRLEDGDMVLCDMGCELHCYASDITNSFPASGKFTPDQRMIFETVAAMQSAVLSTLAPGVQWADMHELAYRVMCERLLEAGLLVGNINAMMAANVGAVLMPHGLGHMMGIDTHDVGGYPKGALRDSRDGYKALRAQRSLEPGMVLTVEPGIYFIEFTLNKAKENPELASFFNWERIADFEKFGGVRLEDNVVVMEDGIQNMTFAPRTVEEVEAVMRGEIVDSVALVTWRDEREKKMQKDKESEKEEEKSEREGKSEQEGEKVEQSE